MAKIIHKPTNFEEAAEILSRPHSKVPGQVKLAYNTYLVEADGYYAVRFHETEILRIYPDHTSYFSGGHRTATTKQRLNALMPPGFWLYQTKWRWLISKQNNIEDKNEVYLFEEGFTIQKNGVVSKGEPREAGA